MPTYEYECLKKHHRFEAFQRMSEDPLKVCPECGGAARRLVSAGAGLLFKGSGFYTTDYRPSEYRARQKAESAGKADGAALGSGKVPSAKEGKSDGG